MFTPANNGVFMMENKMENKVVARIAKKIRATRLEKKLTIQQLATRTRVSKGLLSKIENSRTIPSLPVFVTLIESLDVSLKEFFDDIALFNGKGYLLIRPSDQTPVDESAHTGFSSNHLFSQHVPGRTMQTVVTTIEPGSAASPFDTDGFVFHYVLRGMCEYQINNETVLLDEGDAIYFESAKTIVIANKTKRKTQLLSAHFTLPR